MDPKVVKHEFSKLEQVLIQTADDITKCRKVLKKSLGKHDSRTMRGLHYRSTSKYCLKADIRVVKDMVSELRHVAKRISKAKEPSQSELVAARSAMSGTVDAINDLKSAGNIYDQNTGAPQGKVIGDSKTAGTVEDLVKSTLQDYFSGFSALESQISLVEEALLPWQK
ncbi:Hypothetical protein PHPALM_6655 [Phytophthora palmivora]|uniref:Uncharacterized protein n=1 Tax=Phytophthora palmivora TaxID=4796 RepID=A0A2P4YEA0_9STRA|nr:Hypothetical protein PHPALM_6655 [Phytophthora palmivora]